MTVQATATHSVAKAEEGPTMINRRLPLLLLIVVATPCAVVKGQATRAAEAPLREGESARDDRQVKGQAPGREPDESPLGQWTCPIVGGSIILFLFFGWYSTRTTMLKQDEAIRQQDAAIALLESARAQAEAHAQAAGVRADRIITLLEAIERKLPGSNL